MPITIRFADTDAERRAVYALRYEVYIEEMGFDDPADHLRRSMRDANDDTARLLVAMDGGEIHGTMRINWDGDAPFSPTTREWYDLDPFLDAAGPGRTAIASRFMVRPQLRSSGLVLDILRETVRFVAEQHIELMFGDCQAHLINLYQGLGFRTYTTTRSDPAAGITVPLVMVTGDVGHLEGVASPVLDILLERDVDAALVKTLTRVAGRQSPVKSAALTGRFWTDVLRFLSERGAEDAGFLDGLDEAQVRRLLAGGHVIQCSRGDLLIHEHQKTRTVFCVLSGLLEVRKGNRVLGVAGAGDVVGEIAFVLETPRSCDIVVASEQARILSLSEGVLRRLVDEESSLSARLLLNIARSLSIKLLGRTAATEGR